MQTFLPYPDIRKSLECLDTKRLGKQRVEAFQLLKALRWRFKNPDYMSWDKAQKKINKMPGWVNHPAAEMWAKNYPCLQLYLNISIDVWIARGYKNTMNYTALKDYPEYPWWWGDEQIHSSHRSNLLRKDPVFYGQYNWTEPHDMIYMWPTSDGLWVDGTPVHPGKP